MYGKLCDIVIVKKLDHAAIKHVKQEITVTIYLDVTQDYIYVCKYLFYNTTEKPSKSPRVTMTSSDGEIK